MSKIQTIKSLMNTFFLFQKEFSTEMAFARVLRDLPFIEWNKRRDFFEKKVLEYLKQYVHPSSFVETTEGTDNIWVMWWQGVETMPPIVKACWNQLNTVEKKRKIILITEENWQDWITLPDYIIEKVKLGNITLTHFSDIIRVCLLEKYGGLWLDATMWCEQIPDEVFEKELFTLHAPGMFPNFISRGDFSTFCLGTNKKSLLWFKLIKESLFSYWKAHDFLIDYLIINYIMLLTAENDYKIIEQIYHNAKNYGYYWLNLHINDEFVSENYSEKINISPFQKLSYKNKLHKLNNNGKETYYGYLLKRTGVNDE